MNKYCVRMYDFDTEEELGEMIVDAESSAQALDAAPSEFDGIIRAEKIAENNSLGIKQKLMEKYGQECYDRSMQYVPDGRYTISRVHVLVKHGTIFVMGARA